MPMFHDVKLKGVKSLVREYGTLIIRIAVLIAVDMLWLVPTVQNIRGSASLLALENVDRIGSNIEAIILQNSTALDGAADDIGITPEQYEFILKRLLNREDALQSAALINSLGDVVAAVDRRRTRAEGETTVPFEAQGVVSRAFAGEIAIGEVYVSESLEPHVMLAAPVRKVGKIDGVVIGELNLRSFRAFLYDISVKEGKVYVLDQGGFQILPVESAEFLRRSTTFISRPIVQKVLLKHLKADGLSNDDGYVNNFGIPVFAVGVDLDVGGWGIFLEQPVKVAYLRERQMIFLGLVFAALGSFTVLYMFNSHRKLIYSNTKLKDMLTDLDTSGKLLVRRDLELSRANARLTELDQMKSQFVSTAAHQLRTPLTTLRWSLNELLEGDFGALKKKQRILITDVVLSNNRLINLVNNLLDIARLDEGTEGVRMQKEDIVLVMQAIYNRFKQIAQEKNVAFTCNSSRKTVPMIFDKEKIDIALTNLVDNAIKYTMPGGTVALTLKVIEKEAHIAVADSGVGIPMEQKDRIFSKFFRAHNAILLETSGSGLGLTMVKDIAEKHQGTISFRGNEGGGTIFTLVLPLA